MNYLFQLLLVFTLCCCSSDKKQTQIEKAATEQSPSSKSKIDDASNNYASIDYDVSKWEEITEKDGIILDLRYASENNFTKNKIYDCGRCFLRPELASRIKNLQKEIKDRYGMKLKLFDCYRPKPAQQKLWDIVPDEKYVSNPAKGSMHNRGLAVDVTLVDSNGVELDMGTAFDFFGRRAHSDYLDVPATVLKNRKVLKKMMKIQGLKSIQSEWWHYSLQTEKAPLDDWEWPCK